jgi:hypothetical protein
MRTKNPARGGDRLMAFVLLSACMCLFHGGCTSVAGSYDVKGEAVSVVLLDQSEFATVAAHLKVADNNAFDDQQTESILSAGGIVKDLFDVGVTIVTDQLKKEAAKYAQQYTGSAFVNDFWQTKDQPRIQGLWIRRDTLKSLNPDGSYGAPAAEFLFALVPVEHGKFLAVKPLYARVDRSKSKLASDRINLHVNIAERLQWAGDDGAIQDKAVAVADWKDVSVEVGATYRFNKPSIGAANSTPNSTKKERTDPLNVFSFYPRLTIGAIAAPPRDLPPKGSAGAGEFGRAIEQTNDTVFAVAENSPGPAVAERPLFLAQPATADAGAAPVVPGAGGLMRLEVVITETDATNRATLLTGIAKVVETEAPKAKSQLFPDKTKKPATTQSTKPTTRTGGGNG